MKYTKLSDIPRDILYGENTVVIDMNSQYGNKPIEWIVAAEDYYATGFTFMTKYMLFKDKVNNPVETSQNVYHKSGLEQYLNTSFYNLHLSGRLRQDVVESVVEMAIKKEGMPFGGILIDVPTKVFIPSVNSLIGPPTNRNHTDEQVKKVLDRQRYTPDKWVTTLINGARIEMMGLGYNHAANNHIVSLHPTNEKETGNGHWSNIMGIRPMITVKKDVKIAGYFETNGKVMIYLYDSPNQTPIITDKTTSNRTLYDGDSININGTVVDQDKGDVVTIRYNINNGSTRALSSQISQGTPIPYNKTIVFKEGSLYDGTTEVANGLADGTKHFIKVWAEDDKGGKSEEVFINFYVVNNRPAVVNIEQFTEVNGLVDSDTILVKGEVSDPDGHETTLMYKVNSSPFATIDKGFDRKFEQRIPVRELNTGDNNIVFRAVDEYGARTDKTLRITKDRQVTALNTVVREYKLKPNEGKAKGILLWIQREVGDLTTKVELKFGSSPYKEVEVSHTAPVTDSLEEDEYYYEHDTEEEDIRLRITMNRVSTSSDKVIKLISGVFN